MSDQNPADDSATTATKVENLTTNLENTSLGEEEVDSSKHQHSKLDKFFFLNKLIFLNIHLNNKKS